MLMIMMMTVSNKVWQREKREKIKPKLPLTRKVTPVISETRLPKFKEK